MEANSLGNWSSEFFAKVRHSRPTPIAHRRSDGSVKRPEFYDRGQLRPPQDFITVREPTLRSRLEIYRGLNVTKVGVVTWAGSTEVVTGKEVTVAGPDVEEL